MRRLNGFVILTSLLFSTLLLAGFSEDSICKYDDGKDSFVVGTNKNNKPRSVYICKDGISEPVAILRANKDGVFSKSEVYVHSEKIYGNYINQDGLELKHDPYKYEDELNLEAGDVNQFKYVENNPVNFVDPSGLIKKDPAEQTGGAGPGSGPNFIVSPDGTAYPTYGANGPQPNYNSSGNITGTRFTGGSGGVNGQVYGLRIMDPTIPNGSSPGYPNGYIRYFNQYNQVVDPFTGRTIQNSCGHFPTK